MKKSILYNYMQTNMKRSELGSMQRTLHTSAGSLKHM